LGKTNSIKERAIYVYAPGPETVNEWKSRARKANVSLSQFVLEHVSNSLRQEEGEESYKPRAWLIEEFRKKDEEIQKLTRENEIVKLALERVETELRRYRAEPFLDKGFRGIRKYDRKLIELLKRGEAIDSDYLLCLLRINPMETEGDVESPRKLISVEQMSLLINSVLDTRDKAILTLLAKTGLRRGELISLNIMDVNWAEQSITLQKKQFKKRSSRTVFFDDETGRVLRRWLRQRENLQPETPALFVGEKGGRLKRNCIYSMVVKYAERVGLHDSKSQNPEDHFSPHCFRHWFTTYLRRAGMDREFIKVLRGDRRREAIDIYDRIDREELRRSYLAFVPQLGL